MAFGFGSVAAGAASPFAGGQDTQGSGLFGQMLKRNPNLVPDTSDKASWWNKPISIPQQPDQQAQPGPWDKQPSTPVQSPQDPGMVSPNDPYKLNNPPPWMNDWARPDPNLEHTMPMPGGQDGQPIPFPGDFQQHQLIDGGRSLIDQLINGGGFQPRPNDGGMHLMDLINNRPPVMGGRQHSFPQPQPQFPQLDQAKMDEITRKQNGVLKTDANGKPVWDPKIYDRQGLSYEQAQQLGLVSNGWGGWKKYDPNDRSIN
jgi:hypothetical protein